MSNIPKWIKLDWSVKPHVFCCERCGGTEDYRIPATVEDYREQAQAFGDKHKQCKEESKP